MQRTCVACRKIKAKGELIRIVRTTDGSVEVDAGGRKRGRGAYLCREQECWEVGSKSNRLEHALRINLTPNNREQLVRYGRQFLRG